MKIMFVSDVHGSLDYLKRIKDIYFKEKPNKIIFLGDIFYGGDYSKDEIEKLMLNFPISYFIKGNCDSSYDIMTSSLPFMNYYYFEEFGKKFYCSHGHIYNISNYPELDFDCLVYGHTHKGMITKENDKYFLNPGSISYPRGGSVNSYMIIDEKGVYLKDLEENIIEKINW